MAAYRVYCLDGVNRITHAEWIEANSDEAAVADARRLVRGSVKCEIWQKERLVGVIHPDDPPA